MTLALTDVKKYYSEKLKCDNEWEQLDQGVMMTALRHNFIRKHIVGGTVVDFGCGNGNILDMLHTMSNSAWQSRTTWIGADIIPERQEPFMKRLVASGMKGQFVLTGGDPFEGLQILVDDHKPTTIVICGLLGYQHFTDWQKIVEFMSNLPCRVILTVPILSDQFKDETVHRFDENEIWRTEAAYMERIFDGLMGVVL